MQGHFIATPHKQKFLVFGGKFAKKRPPANFIPIIHIIPTSFVKKKVVRFFCSIFCVTKKYSAVGVL